MTAFAVFAEGILVFIWTRHIIMITGTVGTAYGVVTIIFCMTKVKATLALNWPCSFGVHFVVANGFIDNIFSMGSVPENSSAITGIGRLSLRSQVILRIDG